MTILNATGEPVISLTQTLRPYQARGKEDLRVGSWRIRNKRKTLLVLPTGAGKCVDPDTWVWSGGLRRFGDLFKAQARSPIAGPMESNCIAGWYDDGTRPGYRVMLANGLMIDGTPNHRIWVRDRSGIEDWKQIEDLDPEFDYVAVARGQADFGTEEIPAELAYTMGLETTGMDPVPDRVLGLDRESIKCYIKGFFNGLSSQAIDSKVCADQIQQLCLAIGMNVKLSQKAKIYLLSIIDKYDPQADVIPGVGHLLKQSVRFIDNIQILRRYRVAYISGIVQPSYPSLHKFIALLPDSCPHKAELIRIATEHRIWTRIKSITPSTIARIDCQVDKSHAFIGNGIINHNTSIAADLISDVVDNDWYALFFAHRVELIDQAWQRLKQFGIHGSIFKGPAQGLDLTNPVQVSSVQTLTQRLAQLMTWARGRRILIFVDEAHRVMGSTYLAVLAAIKEVALSVVVVGLTATPYRLDGQGLDDVFDDLVEVSTPTYLFDHGQCRICKQEVPARIMCCGQTVRSYLVRPTMYRIAKPDLSGIGNRGGDYDQAALGQKMNEIRLVADMVKEYKSKADGLQAVAFAVNVAHSKHIAERFNHAGIPAAHMDGETDSDERSDILARFAIGILKIVCNCNLLTDGWDGESDMSRILANPRRYWGGKSFPPDYVPLQVSIDGCPTQSMGRFFQGPIGRITRSHLKKDIAIYLGHAGNDYNDWFPDWHHGFTLCGFKRHKGDRHVSQNNAVSLLTCSCLAVNPAGSINCLICGAVLGKTKNVVTMPGELVEITGSDLAGHRPATPAEKEIKYIELMAEARKMAQRPGFADDNYRAVFGMQPSIEMKNRVYKQFGFSNYLQRPAR